MGLSRAERLKRKKEAEAKRRKRIMNDPQLKADLNKKRRARHAAAMKKRKGEKLPKKVVEAKRRKWRIQKQNQKAKNSENISTRGESMKKVARKRAEKKRLSHLWERERLKLKLTKVTRKYNKYRQKYCRLKLSLESDSPKSKLGRQLKRVKISPDVRRQLLFSTAVATDLQNSYGSTKSYIEKSRLLSSIHFKYVKKYRFLSTPKPFFDFHRGYFPFQRRNRVPKGGRRRRDEAEIVKKCIQDYFEEDSVSSVSPNKNDVIVRKKVRKQKRYLRNSLKYLFIEFAEKSPFVVSYSSFCKLRPFWVINRALSAKDTCLCVTHENIQLMCKQLKTLKILNDSDVDLLIKTEMCCTERTEACFFRDCKDCLDKNISYLEFNAEDKFYYESWEKTQEQGRDGNMYKRMAKIRIEDTVYSMVSKFDEMIVLYMAHEGRRRHQHGSIKELKNSLSSDDLLIYVDFSENYGCKYEREIQEVHFGGNRIQISLHTGGIYSGGARKPQCFCTISSDLQHDPVAILQHLKPILSDYTETARNVHFVSDSPFSQYRNKYMFQIIINCIVPLFKNLERFSWNYTDSRHGKSVADGVGGSVKNTADRLVSHGKDISTFMQFSEIIQKHVPNIKVVAVRATDPVLKDEVWKKAPSVPGTSKVHQVTWSKENKHTLFFNTLSCFECPFQEKCQHYFLRKVNYQTDVAPVKSHDGESTEAEMEIEAEIEIQAEEGIEKANIVEENIVEVENDDFAVNDYVVVKFPLIETKGERRWLGKIMEINDNKFNVWFLKSKATVQHKGNIFSFPEFTPNLVSVDREQLAYKVDEPTKYQRALKFSVHNDKL